MKEARRQYRDALNAPLAPGQSVERSYYPAPDVGPDENVFDIQPGVAVGLFLRTSGRTGVPPVTLL